MANVTLYLPKGIKILSIKKGDKVTFGQTLAEGDRGESVTFDLITLFSTSSAVLPGIVKVQSGDAVRRGDVIAEKKSLLSKKAIHAPFDGQVANYDKEAGRIELVAAGGPHEVIVSPVDGAIAKVGDEAIDITFTGDIVFTKQGIGKTKKGKLTVLNKEDEEAKLTDIDATRKGSVLLVGKIGNHTLEKAFGLGVASIVTTEVLDGDFSHIAQKTILQPSVLILSTADFKTLAKEAGKDAVVQGEHKRIIVQ